MIFNTSNKIRTLLSEVKNSSSGKQIIVPSTEPNTMSFWHGGNLEEFNDVIAQKNGRYEYGPGLYLTTHYGTAIRYAKGRRRLYLITVQKGNDLRDSLIDFEDAKGFVNEFVIKSKRKEVMERVANREKDNGKVEAYIFGNIILNNNAITSANTKHLRRFYIDQGIDYEMVGNAFGWNEMMMVLFNMRKIVNTQIVKSTDTILEFDLPTTWA